MFSIFRMIKKFVGIIFFAIVMSYGVVSAQVEIEIIASEGKKIPITVLPFEGEGDQAKRISEIILSDLTKTGIFAIQSVDSSWSRLKLDDDADYTNWASRAVQNLVVGNFVKLDDGRLQAAFWLYDIPGQAMSVGYQIKDDPKQLHQMAHHFADLIYEKLTGDRGIFSTKIAYVVKKKDQSVLVVADFDGDNPNEIFVSKEPILSPRWAPDGGRIAFVSFLERKAAVYIVPVNYKKKLANGKPRVLGPFLGSNSAPAWSPDGQSMAMAIAKDGGSHIFVVSLKDQTLVQITNSRSINTEPSFSSDGKSLVFTSDRTNRPQVYRVPVSGGTEKPLTDGRYNASAQFSHDDSFIALINSDEGKFNVGVRDMKSGVLQILTDGSRDQSPSIAPNGKIIVYASEAEGRGILRFVSKNGRVKFRYVDPRGDDLREPSWGPSITN